MDIHLDLATRLVKNLNEGFFVPKKDQNGNWYKNQVPYQELLKGYCTLDVPRRVFLSVYKRFLPIEAMIQEEKTEFKKFVNEIFKNQPAQFRLEAVKIIYTIGILSELKK